jgi:hypothetical protein
MGRAVNASPYIGSSLSAELGSSKEGGEPLTPNAHEPGDLREEDLGGRERAGLSVLAITTWR